MNFFSRRSKAVFYKKEDIMKEKNEEKKNRSFWGIFGSGRKFRSLWWIQIVFLLIFLAAAGFYSWMTLGNVAQKLVGGESYEELSASAGPNFQRGSVFGKWNFFDEEKDIAYKQDQERLKKEFAAFTSGDEDWAGKNKTMVSGKESGTEKAPDESGKDVDVRHERYKRFFKGKLRPLNKGVFSAFKTGGSKTSNSFGESNKNIVRVTEGRNVQEASGKLRGTRVSAMKQLEKAWKTGVYGARDASQDAAKSWTARAFDSAAASRFSLEYDEKAKRALDTVNPNSIPSFLREQDVNSAKNLAVKDVEGPEIDKEATKKALANDKKYQAAKAAQDLSKGLLNSMFSGVNFGGQSAADADDGTLGNLAEADDPPKLDDPGEAATSGITVDEYGYIHTVGSDGMNYVFDESGALVGCEDVNAGMCLMPGAGSCPSEMYFI